MRDVDLGFNVPASGLRLFSPAQGGGTRLDADVPITVSRSGAANNFVIDYRGLTVEYTAADFRGRIGNDQISFSKSASDQVTINFDFPLSNQYVAAANWFGGGSEDASITFLLYGDPTRDADVVRSGRRLGSVAWVAATNDQSPRQSFNGSPRQYEVFMSNGSISGVLGSMDGVTFTFSGQVENFSSRANLTVLDGSGQQVGTFNVRFYGPDATDFGGFLRIDYNGRRYWGFAIGSSRRVSS